ncbi:putative transcriptional regulator [Taylorella asinigenitalis 14/45]|uniref:Putative transcriptional regulator n=1 Tax=Taylorella asinigenitalis 14/45 TaxID=1091495 RepID=I7J0Z8_9BURK|nr:RNA-binding domain-containing protein [Taylorella asinigenitalis]CCG19246.1 putative transcriptional regulator [Taylorella asinigenitalis 14/45]
MNCRESFNLEFKSDLSDSFLKTVSAFANYHDGQIIFGVDDKGESLNIENFTEKALIIENKINDNIKPIPEYKIELINQNKFLILKVFEGEYKPYLYKDRAYMRRDTSSLPVDREQLKHLTMEGNQLSYEDLPSKDQNLTFNELKKSLLEKLSIEQMDQDILKTLGLLDAKYGFNLAAQLFADKNNFKLIDIVRYGIDISEFKERVVIENESILSAFAKSIEMYRRYYQVERIEGSERKKIELIPENAFREAIANALVHRDWSINSFIKVEMHEKYIEILSPGSLPKGISEQEYVDGRFSILRNEKVGNLFYRLGIIERFGTGIKRIKNQYKGKLKKPIFNVSQNAISVRLPILIDEMDDLNKNSSYIYQIMPRSVELSRGDIEKLTGLDKSKVLRGLERLIEDDLVARVGRGRGVRYFKK